MLLLVLLLASAPTVTSAPTVDEVIAHSAQLMGRGEYRQGLAELQPLVDQPDLTALQRARLFQLIAAGESQTGGDDRALAAADKAEQAAKSINAFDLLARIESVRGIVWLDRGRSVESLKHFNDCLAWAEKSKQPATIAGALIRLAAAHQDMGDWTRALDAVNRSFEADPNPSDNSRIQYLTRRGLVYLELREGERAKADIAEALSIAERIGDRRSEAQVLIDMSLVVERIDRDPRRASEYSRRAVAVARELKLPPLEIAALNQLGALLREAKDLPEARQTLQTALAEIQRANEHRDEPYVLKNLGQVLVRLGEVDAGARTLKSAADHADAAGLTRVRWIARLELAEIETARDAAAADREFQDALKILEEQQTNVLLEGFRAGALDQTLAEHDPYDRYVEFLLDRGEPDRAFDVAERERARVFLDRLSAARDTLAASLPAGFSDAENDLLRRISASQAQLRNGDVTADGRRDILAAIDRDEAQLTTLRLRLAVDRPALAHARYPKLWSAADLRSNVIAPDEHLVSFFLGSNRSVAWVDGHDGLTTIPLPPRATIERDVRAALQELRDPASTATGAIAALSKTLSIDRIIAAAPGVRLVIAPHGILYDIPLEALPGPDGRPIVERFAVSYAPSASSLAFLRSLPPPQAAATTLLAIGDPVVHAEQGSRTRQVDLAHVDMLAPLPHSAEEISAVAALFEPSARVLEAADATETALRSNPLAGVRMIHFATHGLIDESRPERSGLVLTAAPPDDGLLQTREIYSLPLNAELVTLSACATALGQQVNGEGIIGLTRAFFYAGARAVVASLWDVEDLSTSRLMQRFYENIRAGRPIDIALQQAKLALIHEGGTTGRPFYWASFIVSGQSRAAVSVPPPGIWWRIRTSRTAKVLPIAALLLALSAWLYRKRTAR